jgi:hypothetical protein
MVLKDQNAPGGIEALKRLLEIFGADRSRWPARDRLKFAELLAESAEARRLVAEAEAFDRLLDKAPEPKANDIAALSSRILAAAAADARADQASKILTFSRTAKSGSAPLRFQVGRMVDWPAAALMAASLMLGIFAGTNGYFGDVTGSETDIVLNASYEQSDASALAFGTDEASLLEEDLL